MTSFIRAEGPLEKIVRSFWFWAIGLFLLFTYPLVRSITRKLPPPSPILGQVPEFRLTNEFGKPFGSKQLRGKSYLASFAFTTCPTTCPALMENLQKVQKRVRGLGQKVALVTFSVDPDNDTPKVLFRHARKYRSNPHVWTFLTGKKEDMRSLLIDGFKVPMGDGESFVGKVDNKDVTLFDIAHTTKLVLVDARGSIRGYYSTDKEGINHLMIDLGLLVNREFSLL